RLAGNRAREERLSGAGRADEQDAARDAGAEVMVLRRVAEEVDLLLELRLRLVGARDVVEGDLRPVARVAPRATATEAEDPRLALRRLPAHPPEEPDEEEERAPADDQLDEPGRRRGRRLDDDAVLLEEGEERRVAEGRGDVRPEIRHLDRLRRRRRRR